MSFNMIVPELYGFLEDLKGGDYKGLIIAIFTLMAAISRPISGRLSDRWGRLPVMIIGATAAAIAGLTYIFIPEISGFLLLSPVFVFFAIRFFHGISTGFKPTGTTAYLADIIPENRKGEALGWMGTAGSIGMAIGPALGNYLHLNYGYNSMFFVSFITAILSIVVILGMKETLPSEQKSNQKRDWIALQFSDVWEPRVWPSTLTFFLYAFGFGTVYTLIPDKMDDLNLAAYRGDFFFIYVGFTAITRVLAGKISDRKGRIPVIVSGLIFIVISLVYLGLAESLFHLFVGAALFGMAHGITGPTLFAWTTDLSHPRFRGRAFSTMFIGMEIGIGLGGLCSFAVYNNRYENFLLSFCLMASTSIFALVFLAYYTKKYRKQNL